MPRRNSSDDTTWTDCSPGTLTQLNRRLRATRQRATVMRVAAPVLVLVCSSFGVWAVNQATAPTEFNFGGVSCTEVQANMQQYAMTQLSPELQDSFEIHLEKCPRCQEKMQTMQDGDAVSANVNPETDWKNNFGESFAPHRHLFAANLE
jgi:hypothetical protein